MKRQRIENEPVLYQKSSLFKTTSKMSQKRKKDRMEQQEMAEEEAADETDIFMKELDDEFEDIEDQLFNQDDDEEKS